MPAAGSAAEPGDPDWTSFDQRIDAALTLTTGTPSPLAEELLDDRRTATSWWIRLFAPGFVLFTWLVPSRCAASPSRMRSSCPWSSRSVR